MSVVVRTLRTSRFYGNRLRRYYSTEIKSSPSSYGTSCHHIQRFVDTYGRKNIHETGYRYLCMHCGETYRFNSYVCHNDKQNTKQ